MIEGYKKCHFTAPIGDEDKQFDYYYKGDGKPIVLIQELPGIGPETIAFANRLIASGFSVWMPHLLGPLGKTAPISNIARLFCMQREFQVLSKGKSSAITQWLAAFCRHVKAKTDAKGVGVIGMCLTGNFALTLIADETVLAAVAAQPSLPFLANGPHMSAEEINASRAALDKRNDVALAFRFKKDSICRKAHFKRINEAFNDDRNRIELNRLSGKGHSVFTLHFDSDPASKTMKAYKKMTAYFHNQL